MIKLAIHIILILSVFEDSYSQFQKDYVFTDTLRIENNNFIYRIEADTIFIDKKYGCNVIAYIKVTDLNSNRLVQEIIDTTEMGCFSYDIYIEDINLDGNKDIVLAEGPYNLSSTYAILLFDKKTKSYLRPIYFNDYYIDTEKLTLTSSFQQLNARGGSSEKYSIEKGEIKLIETESISNDYLKGEFKKEIFVEEVLHKRIIGNYFIDMYVNHDASEKDSAIIEVYTTFNDSLVISSKYWSELETEDPTYLEDNNNFFYCDPDWGCYKYYFKEEYKYSVNKNRLKVDTLAYVIKDSVWLPLE